MNQIVKSEIMCRRKIFFLSFVAFILFAAPLRSKEVSVFNAQKIAGTFINSSGNLRDNSELQLVHTAYAPKEDLRSSGETPLYYVFSGENSFIIIAADDRAYPVIGYSTSGSYSEDHAPSFLLWMEDTANGISQMIREDKSPDEQTIKAWDSLSSGTTGSLRTSQAVQPLLQTKWSQGNPYNELCPLQSSSRTLTGCVATAMAQLMYFWKHPLQGTGRSSVYSTRTNKLVVPSINFAATSYDWANMTPTYSMSSTAAARTAVATLMYHCGAAVQMDYGTIESGAYTRESDGALGSIEALYTYFGYDKSIGIKYHDYYSEEEWRAILKAEIDAGRPVFYSGQSAKGGHAFLCSGYDEYSFFHFNWGWAGADDGYFNVQNIEYKYSNEIHTGIQPDKGGECIYEMVIGPNQNSYIYPDISCNVTEIEPDTKFQATASFWNIGLAEFNGSFGFLLLNQEKEIVETLGIYKQAGQDVLSLGQWNLTGPTPINCQVSSAPAGDYILMAAVKPENGKWHTVNAQNGRKGQLPLKVLGGNSIRIPEGVEGVKIYLDNGIPTIDTPYPETVEVYNLSGKRIARTEKRAGIRNLPELQGDKVLMLKGSSGWSGKLLVK